MSNKEGLVYYVHSSIEKFYSEIFYAKEVHLILYIFSYIGDLYHNEIFFSYVDSLVKNVYVTGMT